MISLPKPLEESRKNRKIRTTTGGIKGRNVKVGETLRRVRKVESRGGTLLVLRENQLSFLQGLNERLP
jgi:hypothetical protein